MNLTSYVDYLRQALAVAASAGSEEARVLAESLTAALESATRLTLLNALSAAADEITRDLAPGSVELRLRDGDPAFVVTPPPADRAYDDPAPGALEPADRGTATPVSPMAPLDTDDGPMVRINLRLSEALKARIEEAAGQEGRSANAWLVRAATSVLESEGGPRRPQPPAPQGKQHFTGWVR